MTIRICAPFHDPKATAQGFNDYRTGFARWWRLAIDWGRFIIDAGLRPYDVEILKRKVRRQFRLSDRPIRLNPLSTIASRSGCDSFFLANRICNEGGGMGLAVGTAMWHVRWV